MPQQLTNFFKFAYGWDLGESPGVEPLDKLRTDLDQVIPKGFSVDTRSSTGLNLALHPGVVKNESGSYVLVTPSPVALTASATNYIQRDAYGAITASTGGWQAGKIPIAKATAGPASITTVEDWRPAGGGGDSAAVSMPGTRANKTITTASLAPSTSETGSATWYPGYAVLRVAADYPCRIRLYRTSAQRTADAARPSTADPEGNHGLIAEVLLTASVLSIDMAPAALAGGVSSAAAVYWAITNADGTSHSITASFELLILEA